MRRFVFFFLFLLASSLQAIEIENPVYDYEKNPHVSEVVWETVQPYFLPSNHPIKPKLDKLFASRPSKSEKHLKRAGFKRPKQRPQSKMVISPHKNLPGYWVKLFTDDQDLVDYTLMIHRIKGAQCIERSIEKHGYQKYFKVPKKWIYPLPTRDSSRGHKFILVVEEMDLLSRKSNEKKWRSKAMTEARANAIFVVLKENGLHDTIHTFNLPFCRDGKMAFIDTEYHHSEVVQFARMTQSMPSHLRSFWQKLIAGQPLK